MEKKSQIEVSLKHFFFVRHAETAWNDKKLCQGQKDIALNEKGILEAKAFAMQVKDVNIDCIITSPLTRALQTAQEICHFHSDVKIHIIPQLAERSWGELEGISSEEMYAIEKLEEENPLYTPGRGVEPRSVFRERILSGILESQKYSSHPFIVSHGRVFMELCYLLMIPPVRQLSNCQLVKMTASDSKWKANIIQGIYPSNI